MELSSFGGPFVFLVLLVFGLLAAVLGAFLAIWSNGRPRMWGAGIAAAGAVVLAALIYSLVSGAFLKGTDVIQDVLAPAVIYLLAIVVGAVLGIIPFIMAAIRS